MTQYSEQNPSCLESSHISLDIQLAWIKNFYRRINIEIIVHFHFLIIAVYVLSILKRRLLFWRQTWSTSKRVFPRADSVVWIPPGKQVLFVKTGGFRRGDRGLTGKEQLVEALGLVQGVLVLLFFFGLSVTGARRVRNFDVEF